MSDTSWEIFAVFAVVAILIGIGAMWNENSWSDELYKDQAKCEQYLRRNMQCIQVWTAEVNTSFNEEFHKEHK